MRSLWIVVAAIAVVVGGVIAGIGALILAPVVGVLLALGLIVWVLERRARHKPPVE